MKKKPTLNDAEAIAKKQAEKLDRATSPEKLKLDLKKAAKDARK
jgi:hypothetical protein